MTTEPVLLSAEDGIARIRFNRPERLNAMDMELVAGFARAVETVLADDVVRVIVVGCGGACLRCRG
jgi:2-(1,2-epoxy-1,2-dihydrophenyl)acetyl-CoA isomerase